jgi:hypothetical protein
MKTIIGILVVVSLVLTIGAISEGVARQMMDDNDGEKNEPK